MGREGAFWLWNLVGCTEDPTLLGVRSVLCPVGHGEFPRCGQEHPRPLPTCACVLRHIDAALTRREPCQVGSWDSPALTQTRTSRRQLSPSLQMDYTRALGAAPPRCLHQFLTAPSWPPSHQGSLAPFPVSSALGSGQQVPTQALRWGTVSDAPHGKPLTPRVM